MSRRLEFEIPAELDGRKIRSVLQARLGLSAGLVTRLKHREGAVLLNGRPAKTLDTVHAGDRLSVEVGDAGGSAFAPVPARLSILWEDEDILILDKPADMAVHGRSDKGEPTVGSAVAAYLGTAAPFHPVNRLDRGTTGVMCAAKTGYMHERLRRLLHTEGLRREYLAITQGVPEPRSGVIDLPIGRRGEEKRFCVREDGAASLTRYETLAEGDGLALLRLRPETGRTHQIRVHLSHIGCPILGDRLYGRVSAEIARPALHSSRLTLVHPLTGVTVEAAAPLPEDMRAVLERHGLAQA